MSLRPGIALALLALVCAGCDLLGGEDDPARDLLRQVNDARRTARTCGGERFAAAPALAWNDRLAAAATRHSRDLAAHGRSSHTGSDGSTAFQRITEAGYLPGAFGEAVAVGSPSVRAVIAGWIDSPEHCRVLMDARVREAGAAVAGARYWTLDTAAPAP